MSNMPLRKLRADGVIAGRVVCFARRENASKAFRVLEDQVIVRVMDQVNSGTFWVMGSADAARMVERGFRVVQPVV